jgi:threonine/homoserine/homoserine lactone efflux protein
MLVACLIGFVLAFAGSMPTAGPTGVLVLTWGLDRRYDKALAVALGAALPEAAYASFAFLGFAAVLKRYDWVEPVSQGLGIVILVVLGFLLVTGRAGGPRKGEAASKDTQSRSRVAGPVGAFGVGFGIAALNPAFIANWSIVVAMAHASAGFDLAPDGVLPFACGVVAGIMAWFGVVLVLLARYGERFDAEKRGRALRYMGWLLWLLALVLAGRAASAALA